MDGSSDIMGLHYPPRRHSCLPPILVIEEESENDDPSQSPPPLNMSPPESPNRRKLVRQSFSIPSSHHTDDWNMNKVPYVPGTLSRDWASAVRPLCINLKKEQPTSPPKSK